MVFLRDSFSTSGTTSKYSYPGGSGNNIDYYFCHKCGTGLYAKPLAHEEIVVIRANTLENSSLFTPTKSLFSEQAHSWDKSILD